LTVCNSDQFLRRVASDVSMSFLQERAFVAFVSFNSGDIDLARTTKQGARVLKRYLQFAETGRFDLAAPTGGEPESPFEEAVARTISELGFSADAQVGSAGFKIDLAVKHPTRPGSYVLAVECDGATYHSARWARNEIGCVKNSSKISAGRSIVYGARTGFINPPKNVKNSTRQWHSPSLDIDVL